MALVLGCIPFALRVNVYITLYTLKLVKQINWNAPNGAWNEAR